ncbi:MAG: pyridoxamine 5'-phosphate oxidase family protein, partial [Lutibacter sp.]
IYQILDKNFVAQIAFVFEDYPVVIPTIYGRKNNFLYIHGAPVSRMLKTLKNGIPISLNITEVNGIVLARSAFHHSLNYQSVTIFGKAKEVVDKDERNLALKIISDQIIPNRWDEVRLPNAKELKATQILKIEIEEASAKIRKGPPIDDKDDYDLPIWAGEIPIKKTFLKPIPDQKLNENVKISSSVINFLND